MLEQRCEFAANPDHCQSIANHSEETVPRESDTYELMPYVRYLKVRRKREFLFYKK